MAGPASPASSDSSEEARAFLQRRVALFWKVIFGFGVLSIGVGTVEVVFTDPAADFVINIVTTALSGFLWWLSARGHRSIRFSRWLDAGGLFLNMGLGAFIGRFMMLSLADQVPGGSADLGVQVMADGFASMLLVGGMAMMVTVRAALIPSQPRRTAIVTAIAGLPPLLVSTFVVPTGPRSLAWRALDSPAFPLLPASTATMWAFTVAACAVISWVIFGLRSEVREARRLGQYVLERKLGAGGMGEVYLARHGMMRRPTAIKLLREQASETNLLRFEREVQLTARLTHPNTITIFDYGRTGDGVFYYAMELLEGATLERIVALTGPQPASRVARILRMACGALSEAHGIGLIHRDIKPANMMLCARGGELDVLKVLDFGLVKELEVDGDVQLTADNALAGTPQYLAPESIRDPSTVDHRTDLYGLGAVAYFLLTGGPVFEGKTVVDICAQHLTDAPVPPSVRAEGVPADLEALVLACLEKDPALRPQSADELRRRLDLCAIDRWSARDAKAWWREYGPDLEQVQTADIAPHALRVDRRAQTR